MVLWDQSLRAVILVVEPVLHNWCNERQLYVLSRMSDGSCKRLERIAYVVVEAGLLFRYLNGPFTYIWRTVLSVSKTFPSCLHGSLNHELDYSPFWMLKSRVCVCVWRGGGGGLFTCPYPLKVQARPPRDQRLATQSRVSGQLNQDVTSVIYML